VTLGDPAGIGPDIAVGAWRERVALGLAPFAVIGPAVALRERAQCLGLDAPVEIVPHFDAVSALFGRALPVLDVPASRPVVPGTPDPGNAHAVIQSIDRAVAAVEGGEAGAIVTCPISKSVLQAAGFRHPGHTEYLAALAERRRPGTTLRPVMMLAGPDLRVVPLTIHIPLARVPAAISAPLIIETARITGAALATDFGIPRPRIAVTGLNPHAGENGTLGREEVEIIGPAIRTLAAEGLRVTGPHSADALFHTGARATYDAVIAMYHDQALIPLKTIAFDDGVNVTLGLPFVRTSPDHGTAFDIAGTGRARHHSLVAALRLAAEIALRRTAAGSGRGAA
jgi:4-hydroxythreonine-4-phosphate dehydrogenase